MDETGGQISNVGQQVDGSSDAEESQRLVNFIVLLTSLITLLTMQQLQATLYMLPYFILMIFQ